MTAIQLKKAVDTWLGWILRKPNVALVAAALDPAIFLNELVSAEGKIVVHANHIHSLLAVLK